MQGNKVFYDDGVNILINTPYAEAYIPAELFDAPAEDPTAGSIAYLTADSISTIGIFNIRFFEDESQNRNSLPVEVLKYPNMIETYPYDSASIETLTINGVTDDYRILRYRYGDRLVPSVSQQSPSNCQKFTALMFSGKMPRSLSYDDLYYAWSKNFRINEVSSGIPPFAMQAIISELCRDPDNLNRAYRFVIGKMKSGQVSRDYTMLNLDTVAAYTSAISAMATERFAEKLVTAIVMTQEDRPQRQSPIEKIVRM